ncbi:MAG TPA: TetR/AcrR family transcriptional regulator [Acidimicrobiales bacterium]|nr:TetR/AcrR family transcriptional regulator [Acidimicrobiales bacterium]
MGIQLEGSVDNDVDSEVDGRVLRGQRNREAIVDAMFELYAAGNLRPTAAQIAEAAGISTRSVYHHFDDMESLVAEVSARAEDGVNATTSRPDADLELDEKVPAFVQHRITRWEKVHAVVRAARLGEYASPIVANALQVGRARLREDVELTFAPELAAAADPGLLLEGLDLLFGFEVWERLRLTQKLDPTTVATLLTPLVRSLF